MRPRLLLSLLILFVLADLGYTFWQNYQLPLEGDMPQIVLPAPDCQKVLEDPFGWAALTRQEVYVAPNRFFAHAGMGAYFKSVPFVLQALGVSPLDSIYATCALFNTLVQALIMYVLGRYATGTWSLRSRRLWATMALLVPLFQIGGYHDHMGVADNSITYTFFYAFPLLLLLLYFLPFYDAEVQQRPFRVGPVRWLLLLGLMVVLSFNGAIVPGVVAVVCVGIGLRWLVQQGPLLRRGQWAAVWQRIPWQPFGLLIIFGLLSLYSLYLGQFEAERLTNTNMLPVWERYERLPLGLNDQFRRPGLPVFIGAVLLNLVLIRWATPRTESGRRLLRIGRWLGLFALVFVLLLPLGGFRVYRPLILRRDSILPITLGLLGLYTLTSYYLLGHLPTVGRRVYLGWVLVLSTFYMVSDRLLLSNECERQSIRTLADTPAPIVLLPNYCTVVSWQLMTHSNGSETAARMLEYWGVVWGKRLYHQKPKPETH